MCLLQFGKNLKTNKATSVKVKEMLLILQVKRLIFRAIWKKQYLLVRSTINISFSQKMMIMLILIRSHSTQLTFDKVKQIQKSISLKKMAIYTNSWCITLLSSTRLIPSLIFHYPILLLTRLMANNISYLRRETILMTIVKIKKLALRLIKILGFASMSSKKNPIIKLMNPATRLNEL